MELKVLKRKDYYRPRVYGKWSTVYCVPESKEVSTGTDRDMVKVGFVDGYKGNYTVLVIVYIQGSLDER